MKDREYRVRSAGSQVHARLRMRWRMQGRDLRTRECGKANCCSASERVLASVVVCEQVNICAYE